MNAVALQTTVADLIAEYEEKRDALASKVSASGTNVPTGLLRIVKSEEAGSNANGMAEAA